MTEQKIPLYWLWVVLAVFVALGAVAKLVPGGRPPVLPPVKAAPATPRRPVPDLSWKACTDPGSLCKLRDVHLLKSVDWVPTATSPAALEEMRKAIRAGAKDWLVQLLSSGDILSTKAGDQIRVLDVSVWDGRTEGRLMSGKHAGAKVSVDMEWLER